MTFEFIDCVLGNIYGPRNSDGADRSMNDGSLDVLLSSALREKGPEPWVALEGLCVQSMLIHCCVQEADERGFQGFLRYPSYTLQFQIPAHLA